MYPYYGIEATSNWYYMSQHIGREWVFTINEKKEWHPSLVTSLLAKCYDNCKALATNPSTTYLVVKGELSGSGNHHLQGFVIFANALSRNQVKEQFSCSWMYLAKRSKDSSSALAAAYVMKEETAWDTFPLVSYGGLPMVAPNPSISKDMKESRVSVDVQRTLNQHRQDLDEMCTRRGIPVNWSRNTRYARLLNLISDETVDIGI